jgi:hypothetical protein
METKNRAESQYFANKEGKDCASVLMNRSTSFFNMLSSNAYLEKINRMWKMYHGAFGGSVGGAHQIQFTGEQEELVSLNVNHFRNIAQHIYVMITSQRPSMDARAINTDYRSMSQTYLANGILDYYMREKRLEDALKKAVELSIVLGAGYVKMDWNATAGEVYDADPETGEFNYEGELEFSNLTPLDVIVDGTKETWDHDWMMVRTFKNRYNLMAKYPELAEKIKGIPNKADSAVYRLAIWSNDDTDDVPVYEFYHKKTEALPEGRYMLFLDEDCILLDMKMPYRTIPIFRIVPGEILGTPYGYSPMFDVFPLQEGANSLYSAIMTNQNASAVQQFYVPRGADISYSAIGEGMAIIEGNAKPEPLNLTETAAETFKFLEMLVQAMETISGVNSVSRGNPEASLKSGAALALVQSMSLQFMSGLQQSYVKLIEDCGTSLIQILKDFATTPKIVALVGKNNRSFLKEFTGESISDINRVIVDMGNPLSRTIAGRVQMAEQMMQMKLLKSPEQYFQVINTGRLDATFHTEMTELLLIQSENERLLEGDLPIVSPLDQHSLHIQEHKSVLADPELRKNADLVKISLDHIQEHLNALRNTDPALLQLVGEQPIPPLAPPMEPGMDQGAPLQQEGQPYPNKGSLNGQNSKVMQGQEPGMMQGGQSVQTGEQFGEQNLPNLPKVDPNLLPNPEMQEASMGNLK